MKKIQLLTVKENNFALAYYQEKHNKYIVYLHRKIPEMFKIPYLWDILNVLSSHTTVIKIRIPNLHPIRQCYLSVRCLDFRDKSQAKGDERKRKNVNYLRLLLPYV